MSEHRVGERLATLLGRLAVLSDHDGVRRRLQELADWSGANQTTFDGAVLDRLAAAYGLSWFETDLVLISGLTEEHEVISFCLRGLNPSGEPFATPGLAAELLELDVDRRLHLRRSLRHGPLHQRRIVQTAGTLPLPEQSLRLLPGLWSVLRGIDEWPEGLDPVPVVPFADRALGHGALTDAVRTGPVVISISSASDRSDRELAAAALHALDESGTEAAPFDATKLADEALVDALSVHCVARGVTPLLIGNTPLAPLPDHPGPVILCGAEEASIAADDRSVVAIELSSRSISDNVDLWSRLVPELNGGVNRLASLLQVDGERAARATGDARAIADLSGAPLDVDSLLKGVRRRAGSELPASVALMHPRSSWDHLVTTERNGDLLRAVVARIEHGARVLDDWGFGLRSHQPGVRALFAGSPGTGKTLAAEVIAQTLGLDLLVVDLSALVSKWLGETEKNISQIFNAAEQANAVLFFDEADSIFGKRTDGADAQGRWANLETAHLLMRMERSKGLVLLATNLRGNIDDAFVRRLDIVVEFDEPGPNERRRLWETHLPATAPLDDDVDLEQLADLYEITGGIIRNAAIDAAYRAADDECRIDQRRLMRSIEREFNKAGRSFPGIPRSFATTTPGGI